MKSFHPRIEILPDNQRGLLPSLAPLLEMGFVLYGGTAIALRLGHRESLDFDFFTSEQLEKDRLRSGLGFLSGAQLLQDSENTLSVITTTGVKVSFFGGLSFGRFGEAEKAGAFNVLVAPLDDLLALKLKILHQRAEMKDYKDISAILASGVPLERGMAIACAMFGETFSPTLTAKALTYFEDGDLSELPMADREALVLASTKLGPFQDAKRQSSRIAGVPPSRGG